MTGSYSSFPSAETGTRIHAGDGRAAHSTASVMIVEEDGEGGVLEGVEEDSWCYRFDVV